MSEAISIDKDVLTTLYIDKKYEEIISSFSSRKNLSVECKNKLGYAYFHSHQFEKAYEIFTELKKDYKAGQAQVMLGNLDKAYSIFDKAKPSSSILWGKCLVELIQMKLSKPPSFLQIRNFFESDLSLLIEVGKIEYAENLIKWNELLADLNSETYKFIGKVLFYHNYHSLAKDYLIRSKEILPGDPETYYYLAQYYKYFEEDEIAIKQLKQAININPDYTPAKTLLKKIECINK